MASCQDNFGSLALEDDETVLAIRLAEALRADEVETFLEIYDSIPSTTEMKRVSIGPSMVFKNRFSNGVVAMRTTQVKF